MELIFLGHCATQTPSQDHTNFIINNEQSTLVDAGPNIVKRMREHKIPLESIDNVIITHKHCDHYLGLPQLIWFMGNINEKEIRLFSSPEIIDHFKKLYYFLFSESPKIKINFIEISFDLQYQIGSAKLTPFPVKHTVPTFGFSLISERKSLVYSSDTEICEGVIKNANNSDILIHDVYSNGTTNENKRKGHSFAAEVGHLAWNCKVKKLIIVNTNEESLMNNHCILKEIKECYPGDVIIPEDGQIIRL
ncbi:MAG: MBL fold metallo-hydrolase [Thermoleophilia bacterium]